MSAESNDTPGYEMLGRNLGTDFDKVFRAYPEFRQLALGFHIRLREMATLSLVHILEPDRTCADLEGCVAVLVRSLVRNHLTVIELKHGHRDVLAILSEQPAHAQFLCDDT
jgi:hypothetical protein